MLKVRSRRKKEDKADSRSPLRSAPPPPPPSQPAEAANIATPEMVMYCYDVLFCYWSGAECPPPNFNVPGEL